MWQLADIYSCLWWTNVVIRKLQSLGQESGRSGGADRFVSGLTDAVIAAQNVVVAAESLGMGTVLPR